MDRQFVEGRSLYFKINDTSRAIVLVQFDNLLKFLG